MEASDFTGDFPGKLVPLEGNLQAFVPCDLPSFLHLPPGVHILGNEAERAIGRLGGLLYGAGSPVNPHLVGRPLQRREAIESSRIEGTFTTPEQLVLLDAEDDAGTEPTSDTQEVQNYIRALDWGMQALDTLPISQRLIREVHARLMRGVRGEQQRPGEFRNVQNFIGRSQDPREARFVPPPVGELPRLLTNLERYVHIPPEERELSRLVRLALIHYQFETIHPFRDGNGRVGRILIPLLIKSEEPNDPPLYLSAYFEQRRQQYYDLLLAVSQRGAFAEWIEFFLLGVKQSAEESIHLTRRLLELRQTYLDRAHQERWPAPTHKLIDCLFESPILTIRRAEQLTEVSTPTASAHLKRLEDADIIEEYTGRARNRKFLARGILQAVHGATERAT